jgi:hypothetical protein
MGLIDAARAADNHMSAQFLKETGFRSKGYGFSPCVAG